MAEVDYLDTIGKARQDVKTFFETEAGEIVNQFAKETIDQMKSETPTASGKLKASLGFNFNIDGEQITIEFYGDDYWDYVNSGVDGVNQSAGAVENKYGSTYSFKSLMPSKKMIDSFLGGGDKRNWLASKGITSLTFNGKTKQLQTESDYRAAAFVFARAVKSHGIKPSNFVGKALTEERIKNLEESLIEAFANLL